jgi:hypothetical protein
MPASVRELACVLERGAIFAEDGLAHRSLIHQFSVGCLLAQSSTATSTGNGSTLHARFLVLPRS